MKKTRTRAVVYLQESVLEMVQEIMKTENRSMSNAIETLLVTGAYIKLQMINDKRREAMKNE